MQQLIHFLQITLILFCLFFIVVYPQTTTEYPDDETTMDNWGNGTATNSTSSTVSTTRSSGANMTTGTSNLTATTTASSAIGGPIYQQSIGLALVSFAFLLFRQIN